jgi:hypothetical protein
MREYSGQRTQHVMTERGTNLDRLLVRGLMRVEIPQSQPLRPVPFVEIHQHTLLQLRLAVIDSDRVIMPVEAMDEGLNGRLVYVSNVGGRLPCLTTSHDGMLVDETECINDDLALDGLNRIDHDRD